MGRCRASVHRNKAAPQNKEKKPQKIGRSVSNASQNPRITQAARFFCPTKFTASQNTRLSM